MRRLPPWLWLVMALVFGTTATFMALGWLRGQSEKRAEVEVKMRPVVVAAKDIEAAMALAQDQVVVRHWPQENAPRGSFARVDEVAGRVTAYSFGAGEPILEVKLAPQGASPGLTALLDPEKRAMTVKVDEASGVAGFLSPNNRVDVVATMQKGEFQKDPVSKVVLQNLRILGTGQRIESRPGEKPQIVPTVTLEVTPEEGEALALAVREGNISLALRNSNNQEIIATRGVQSTHLVAGLPGMTDGGGPGGNLHSIEVIRGPYIKTKEKKLERTTQKF
jgi:pilus assembly protein CpaB